MKLVALGRSSLLFNTIRRLADAGHEFKAIATCRPAPEYPVVESDFERLANELNADFFQTQNINRDEWIDRLSLAGADAAVSVNWISIVGERVCSLFRWGVLNAHAGDLPRYRGNAPVAWAILNGESQAGVTVHQMDPFALDAGPIVVKEFVPLTDETYVGDVFKRLDELIPRLFLKAVDGLDSGVLAPAPQPEDPSLALRCYPRRPEDGLVDWREKAEQIARLVRASAEPFQGAYTEWNGERLTIWRASWQPWPEPSLAVPGQVVYRDKSSGVVGIAASDGIVDIEEIESPKSGRVTPANLIKSLRERVGRRLSSIE